VHESCKKSLFSFLDKINALTPDSFMQWGNDQQQEQARLPHHDDEE
jgi:hypothetical protein